MTALLVLCFLGLQAAFIWARYAVFRVDGRTPPAGIRPVTHLDEVLAVRHDAESSDWFAHTFGAEFQGEACTSN